MPGAGAGNLSSRLHSPGQHRETRQRNRLNKTETRFFYQIATAAQRVHIAENARRRTGSALYKRQFALRSARARRRLRFAAI